MSQINHYIVSNQDIHIGVTTVFKTTKKSAVSRPTEGERGDDLTASWSVVRGKVFGQFQSYECDI